MPKGVNISKNEASKYANIKYMLKKCIFPLLMLMTFLAFPIFVNSDAQALSPRTNVVHPVIWKTKYAKFSASDFYIRVGDKYFYGVEPYQVNSNPGTTRTTMEVSWKENDRTMCLYMYFNMDAEKKWEMSELRTCNGEARWDWSYYPKVDSSGSPVVGIYGSADFSNKRQFLSNDGGNVEFFCRDCTIEPFLKPKVEYSAFGYGLELMTGIPENETISLSNDPTTYYGTNILLRNSKGEVVTDQKEMVYEWQSLNENVVQVTARPISEGNGVCSYGVKEPCPPTHGQLTGVNPGITKVQISVKKGDYIIATTDFDVKVVDRNADNSGSSTPTPSPMHTPQVTTNPTPTPYTSVTPEPSFMPSPLPVDDGSLTDEQLEAELEKLKSTVGEIKVDVAQQEAELNILQRIVKSLSRLFRRFF